jgi:hypothetical protein
MNKNIKLIRKLAWEEVFIFWYENEGKRKNWNKLAKERGFASWAQWRLKEYADRLQGQEVDWGLYEVADPAKVVSEFFGGPFQAWTERYYDGEKTRSFSELAKNTGIINNKTICAMVNDFPTDNIIICLELANNKIYTIEGMHRCCALALMNKEERPAPASLCFAIGKSIFSDLPICW